MYERLPNSIIHMQASYYHSMLVILVISYRLFHYYNFSVHCLFIQAISVMFVRFEFFFQICFIVISFDHGSTALLDVFTLLFVYHAFRADLHGPPLKFLGPHLKNPGYGAELHHQRISFLSHNYCILRK